MEKIANAVLQSIDIARPNQLIALLEHSQLTEMQVTVKKMINLGEDYLPESVQVFIPNHGYQTICPNCKNQLVRHAVRQKSIMFNCCIHHTRGRPKLDEPLFIVKLIWRTVQDPLEVQSKEFYIISSRSRQRATRRTNSLIAKFPIDFDMLTQCADLLLGW